MKYHIILLSLALACARCGKKAAADGQSEEKPKTAVTLTHAVVGNIEQEIALLATTVYQNKSVVAAPIAGFVAESLVQPGARVSAGQTLYRIESKERRALGAEVGGMVAVTASQRGIVMDVLQQTGDYVSEGTVLCALVDAGSLAFEINVPYEQWRLAHDGARCVLELPDGTRLAATVRSPLATMNAVSQSERVLAYANAPFLPEGMNVRALFTTGRHTKNGMVLPRGAVQSDESITEFWVMKLADDSTALRVPVEVVASNDTAVEIVADGLSERDRIVLTGGYGLEDGADIVVVD